MSTVTPPRSRPKPDAAVDDRRDGGPKPAPAKPPGDPRLKALWRFAISITLFTIAGALVLGFENSYAQPLVALATAYPLELLLEKLDAWSCKRQPRYRGGFRALVEFLLPAHIMALSVGLLLYPGTRMVPIVFTVAVATCSKYILTVTVRGKRKHFLNPSNFGLAVTLLVIPSVGISPPYQFTEGVAQNSVLAWLIPAGVIMTGTALNVQLTKKWPLILGWLGGFLVQAVLRAGIFGTPLIAPLIPLTGLVFWLYTNYMITDPGTTPIKPRNQFIFGASVALVYGLLVSVHIVFGLFFALTIVCALRGLVLVAPEWRAALARSRLRPSTARVSEAAQDVAS